MSEDRMNAWRDEVAGVAGSEPAPHSGTCHDQ